MARSIKLKDENYIDSTGIVHNKTPLNIILNGVILYENENGSNSNIDLVDNINNYTFVDVYYRNNDQFYTSRRFYKPNNKKVILDSYYTVGASIVFKMQSRTFNGTKFNVNANYEVNNNQITVGGTNSNTYVFLILGYK